MKKTIRLTLLAAAAALVLTSCDAMLESLFPKDTVGTGSGNNSITIDVQGHDFYSYLTYNYVGLWSVPGGTAYGATALPIHVELYDQQGNMLDQSGKVTTTSPTTYFTSGGGASAWSAGLLTFNGLKDGSYTVKVWFDYDNSGVSTNAQAYYSYYYTDYGYVDSTQTTSLYMPHNSNTSATMSFDLWEYDYYGYGGYWQ